MLLGAFFLIMLIMFSLIIGIGGTILWIWAIINCIQNRRLSDGEKVLWVLLIIFTHLIGAIIYFIVSRSSNRMIPYQYTGAPIQQPQPQQPYQYNNQGPMPMYQEQRMNMPYEAPRANYPEQYPPQ